jgi:integron integrase
MKQRRVPAFLQPDYRKWLRYFLDFRSRYPLPESRAEQVRSFAEKLRSKNQTAAQQEQAADSVSIFFSLEHGGSTPVSSSSARPYEMEHMLDRTQPVSSATSRNERAMICEPPGSPLPSGPYRRGGKQYDEWRCLKKTESPEWDDVISKLSDEIKTRHYSRKTLKHYADWGRKFQSYLKNKRPVALSSSDVKAYLTHLAVNCKVSSSHQNLALNALLFLFRHVLKTDFGDHKDIPRAKKSNYIPTVLSRQEIDAVLAHLAHPYKLVAQLQYGCGLRISEGCKLRVKDFNFDSGLLTVRGKGEKTRTIPMPQKLVPELQAQLEIVKKLHDADLHAGFHGVFLDDQLEKKYPKAAKELVWQWFFPQESLTFIPGTKQRRRYHLHDSHVQDALYEAVRKARLTKRVTSHTFRHSYATHLLQAGYDIRTIQRLLGHSDVRTTMVYTHCLPSRPEKELKSPLDF